jgi:hypothetical protein
MLCCVCVWLRRGRPRLEGWIRDNETLSNGINSINSEMSVSLSPPPSLLVAQFLISNSSKLKSLMKESESRLLGGKNLILRHRVSTDDYNVVSDSVTYSPLLRSRYRCVGRRVSFRSMPWMRKENGSAPIALKSIHWNH